MSRKSRKESAAALASATLTAIDESTNQIDADAVAGQAVEPVIENAEVIDSDAAAKLEAMLEGAAPAIEIPAAEIEAAPVEQTLEEAFAENEAFAPAPEVDSTLVADLEAMASEIEEVAPAAAAEVAEIQGEQPKTQQESKPSKELIPTYAGIVQVQPRTLLLEKPVMFFFEPVPPKRKVDEGNDQNAVEGPHQVDPHRPASYAPMMPDIMLMRDTGNPFPPEITDKVVTTKRWDKLVALSHAVWKLLMDKGEVVASEIELEAAQLAGVGMKKDGSDLSNDAKGCVRDTLRDLRLYGLVTSEGPLNERKKTKFRLIDDPYAVKTLKEDLAAEEPAAA